MANWYHSLFDSFWSRLSRYCIALFTNEYKKIEGYAYSFIHDWLSDMLLILEKDFAIAKSKRCLVHLFKTFIFAMKEHRRIKKEVAMRFLKHDVNKGYLRFGKVLTFGYAFLGVVFGVLITMSYQDSFDMWRTLQAFACYVALMVMVVGARALTLQKLSLIILSLIYIFSGPIYNQFFSTTDCYGEFCAFVQEGTIFQSTLVKASVLAVWLSYLLLTVFKTPVSYYLRFRESENRVL